MARVLIVDDSPFMKGKLKDLVEKSGNELVGEADTTEELFRLVKEKNPSLVIMDISMPEMNGIETIRAIRSMKQEMKIIVCSALGQQEIIVSAIQAGAHDFIVKPFFDGRVVTSINELLLV